MSPTRSSITSLDVPVMIVLPSLDFAASYYTWSSAID